MAGTATKRLGSRLARNQRGTAVVETAIMLPVIVMLLLGMLEMGRAIQQHHTLTKSVRDAARYLARVSLACPATADSGWTSARSTAQHLARTGELTGGQPRVATWTDDSLFTVADPVCETWSGRSVQLMTVSADVAYQDLGLLRVFGLPPVRLAAANQQVHIGE